MNKSAIVWLLAGVLFIGGVVWLIKTPGKPGKYDEFASCIAETGTIFYGAFWCPHCQEQKAMFGSSAKLLPYKECSTPDGKSQTLECDNAGVASYPTWVFPDDTIETGTLTLGQLKEKTSCELPDA